MDTSSPNKVLAEADKHIHLKQMHTSHARSLGFYKDDFITFGSSSIVHGYIPQVSSHLAVVDPVPPFLLSSR